MSHRIIISSQGTGPDGSAESTVEWTPAHTVSGNEQQRKVERVEKLLEKINDVLYGASDYDHD